MIDRCVNEEGCLNSRDKECYKKEHVKGYIKEKMGEKSRIINCPDKEKSYLNDGQRSKEVDMIFETQSYKKIAVEFKSIRLYSEEYEKDIVKVIQLISQKSSESIKKNYDVYITIKKGFKSIMGKIERFIDEFNINEQEKFFYDKKMTIEFKDKTFQNYNSGEHRIVNDKNIKTNVIMPRISISHIILENEDQIFFSKLPEKGGEYLIRNLFLNVEKTQNELIRFINSKEVAFAKYSSYAERVLFIDVEFSPIVQSILEEDHDKKIRYRIEEIWMNWLRSLGCEIGHINAIVFCLDFFEEEQDLIWLEF